MNNTPETETDGQVFYEGWTGRNLVPDTRIVRTPQRSRWDADDDEDDGMFTTADEAGEPTATAPAKAAPAKVAPAPAPAVPAPKVGDHVTFRGTRGNRNGTNCEIIAVHIGQKRFDVEFSDGRQLNCHRSELTDQGRNAVHPAASAEGWPPGTDETGHRRPMMMNEILAENVTEQTNNLLDALDRCDPAGMADPNRDGGEDLLHQRLCHIARWAYGLSDESDRLKEAADALDVALTAGDDTPAGYADAIDHARGNINGWIDFDAC